MNRVYIATALNFFFPGAGYLLLGTKMPHALLWLTGAIGLTYVELSVQTAAPALCLPMFASVFVFNTAFAIDTYKEAKAALPAG